MCENFLKVSKGYFFVVGIKRRKLSSTLSSIEESDTERDTLPGLCTTSLVGEPWTLTRVVFDRGDKG